MPARTFTPNKPAEVLQNSTQPTLSTALLNSWSPGSTLLCSCFHRGQQVLGLQGMLEGEQKVTSGEWLDQQTGLGPPPGVQLLLALPPLGGELAPERGESTIY